jgi:phosphotransferase system, enzyme I, PtsP
VTRDGLRLPLYVNTGLLSDINPARDSGAEGVGLYRTELPFMVRQSFPTEEDQYIGYCQVLEPFAPRPVTMRTLDVGGDKPLPYFAIVEDNPYLGWRGIRLTLDHPELFLTQFRALLRAHARHGNLKLLLPMVSTVSEVDEALLLLRKAHHEICEEGCAVPLPEVGVMVEVPSAVFQSSALARRVDFISVGTNDLTQYLLAVDRNNPRVASLYDGLHPAVIQAVAQVVRDTHAVGKTVSVCGELAGDPAGALLFLGMGIDSLSLATSALPRIKWLIRSFTATEARSLLAIALTLEDPHTIRALLHGAIEEAGLGSLIGPSR